jgi:hypothetical protein
LILNVCDQVYNKIAAQSDCLFQSCLNKDDLILQNFEKDFKDFIKDAEHMKHIEEPPTPIKQQTSLTNLTKTKRRPIWTNCFIYLRFCLAKNLLKFFSRVYEMIDLPKDWLKCDIVDITKKDNGYQSKNFSEANVSVVINPQTVHKNLFLL